MAHRNGDGEHERGMDALQKGAIVGLAVAVISAILWRLGIERMVR